MAQSYKIFIKDVPLLLLAEEDRASAVRLNLLADASAGTLSRLSEELLAGHAVPAAGYGLVTESPEETLSQLKAGFMYIQASGGIVWNRQDELLMIFRRGKWDLPKGKVEEGETTEVAALREVEEESGVGMLRLIHKFESTFHIYLENKNLVLKETHWYEMLSHDQGLTTPQTSEGITAAHWVPQPEIPAKLEQTYASVSDLMGRVLQRGYRAAGRK